MNDEATGFKIVEAGKITRDAPEPWNEHLGTPIPRPERMDDPIRSVRYRVYRDGGYDPSNADARLLFERLRAQEGEAAKLRGLLDRAAWIAEHLMQMIPDETWRASGGDDGQGHYEGDVRASDTFFEIQRWKEIVRG